MLLNYHLKVLKNHSSCEISQRNFVANFWSKSVIPFNSENVQFLKPVFYPIKIHCKRNFTVEHCVNQSTI
ncbi:hypothetical protein THF1C08_390036 [Vibrio jasicida]|uniref:Uncharacterized protein n=1 Tax=Vibrio jasicida TaxID=766224 RepID=A0AAU9QSW7_9VIBR|nr:hypothetical protein THF1C08_390036 [Vibrio jasicida]CAH1599008.1 hypothetical protein THF1A12_390036 [Vibrio jasicida]